MEGSKVIQQRTQSWTENYFKNNFYSLYTLSFWQLVDIYNNFWFQFRPFGARNTDFYDYFQELYLRRHHVRKLLVEFFSLYFLMIWIHLIDARVLNRIARGGPIRK